MAGSTPSAPSDWIVRWTRPLPSGLRVLDIACGSGRHVRWSTTQGHAVTGIDCDENALAALPPAVERIHADLEGAPWPLPGRTFDVVIVTNYLWRPLLPDVLGAVAPGGWLLYETFASGQAHLGRPRNPDYLLRDGELLQIVDGHLAVVAFEQGLLAEPARVVQRIAARRAPDAAAPAPIAA